MMKIPVFPCDRPYDPNTGYVFPTGPPDPFRESRLNIPVEADTGVQDDAPNTNFGSAVGLILGATFVKATIISRTLERVNFTGVIPDINVIGELIFVVGGEYDCHRVAGLERHRLTNGADLASPCFTERLLVPFVESEATWNKRNTNDDWGEPGADEEDVDYTTEDRIEANLPTQSGWWIVQVPLEMLIAAYAENGGALEIRDRREDETTGSSTASWPSREAADVHQRPLWRLILELPAELFPSACTAAQLGGTFYAALRLTNTHDTLEITAIQVDTENDRLAIRWASESPVFFDMTEHTLGTLAATIMATFEHITVEVGDVYGLNAAAMVLKPFAGPDGGVQPEQSHMLAGDVTCVP